MPSVVSRVPLPAVNAPELTDTSSPASGAGFPPLAKLNVKLLEAFGATVVGPDMDAEYPEYVEPVWQLLQLYDPVAGSFE